MASALKACLAASEGEDQYLQHNGVPLLVGFQTPVEGNLEA